MASRLYTIYNSTVGGAAPIVKQATGTATRTMLSVSWTSLAAAEIVEWGISFDGSSAATPGYCELLVHTGGPLVTGYTNLAATDVGKLSFAASGLAAQLTFASPTTSFAPGAGTEVTPTGIRQGDIQLLPPNAPYIKQFPLERGVEVQPSETVRIRCTFGTTVNAIAYIVWQE